MKERIVMFIGVIIALGIIAIGLFFAVLLAEAENNFERNQYKNKYSRFTTYYAQHEGRLNDD